MKRIIIMSIARGSEEIWPKLTHSSRMIRVHIHSLAALICWIDAKSCLNKECSRCWSSYYSCAAAAFYVADGQGDDDDYRLVLLLLTGLTLTDAESWMRTTWRSGLGLNDGGRTDCLLTWLVLGSRFLVDWQEREISNEVQITLLFRFVIFRCLVLSMRNDEKYSWSIIGRKSSLLAIYARIPTCYYVPLVQSSDTIINSLEPPLWSTCTLASAQLPLHGYLPAKGGGNGDDWRDDATVVVCMWLDGDDDDDEEQENWQAIELSVQIKNKKKIQQ